MTTEPGGCVRGTGGIVSCYDMVVAFSRPTAIFDSARNEQRRFREGTTISALPSGNGFYVYEPASPQLGAITWTYVWGPTAFAQVAKAEAPSPTPPPTATVAPPTTAQARARVLRAAVGTWGSSALFMIWVRLPSRVGNVGHRGRDSPGESLLNGPFRGMFPSFEYPSPKERMPRSSMSQRIVTSRAGAYRDRTGLRRYDNLVEDAPAGYDDSLADESP